MAPLASRLLTVEIVIFELLFWIPRLSAGPSNHLDWGGNAITIAGASWVVSDSICQAVKGAPTHIESAKEVSTPV